MNDAATKVACPVNAILGSDKCYWLVCTKDKQIVDAVEDLVIARALAPRGGYARHSITGRIMPATLR